MFIKSLFKSGWIHALFIGLVAYPAGSLTQKMVASMPEGNTLVYTFLFMLSSACALLSIAGPGELVVRTLRRPETWIYGILQICVLIFGLSTMKYVSATEGAGLWRTTGLITLFLSSFFLQQKISKAELLGGAIIFTGVCLIIDFAQLSIDSKILLVIFVIGRALSQSTQKIITEIHKTNRKAEDFKSQIRVTAFIMTASSLVFALLLVVIAFIKGYHDIEILKPFPHFTDFLNLKVYGLAVIVGFCILSVSKYCEFYAGKTIGAKYLTTILSLQIIVVYGVEKILGKAHMMEELEFTSVTFIALTFILLGNFIISASGFFADLSFIKKGQKQNTLANMDDNFIDSEKDFEVVKLNLSNLLALYDNNSKKLSEEIEVDRIKLENIFNYELEDLKLERVLAKKINVFASKNVSLKDKLTKAYNRYYLNHKVNELLRDEVEFKIYLLDLNKFKYVNDKFGHKAGDLTLVEIVERLNSLIGKENVFRIGGDEFVLIQTENLEVNLNELILEKIEEPINYKENILEVSTSIGLALSNEHHDLSEMLAFADKAMYKNKNDRKR